MQIDIFEKYFRKEATAKLPCTIESRDSFLYCERKFKVKLSPRMYRLELCKNPPVMEVNILDIEGELHDFKKCHDFPHNTVSLHLNAGVVPRNKIDEIVSSTILSVLDFIASDNPFKKPLQMKLGQTIEDNFYDPNKFFQPTILPKPLVENKSLSFEMK